MTNYIGYFFSAVLGAMLFYGSALLLTPPPENLNNEIIADLERRLSELEALLTDAVESMPPPGRISPEEKMASLINAGFDQATIDYILDNELEIQTIIAVSEQTRQNPRTKIQAKVAELKTRLGDEGFAAYLEATGRQSNILVETVLPNGYAAEAGILPEDKILRYAGVRIYGITDLQSVIGQTPITNKVPIVILRGDQRIEMDISVGEFGATGSRGLAF
jgi:hypothetical protein